DLAVRRRTVYSDFAIQYVRTATTAVGLDALLETQRLMASGGYHHPAVVDVTVSAAVFFNQVIQADAANARVYRVSAETVRAFGPAFSIAFLYSLDLQHGLLTTFRQDFGVPGLAFDQVAP